MISDTSGGFDDLGELTAQSPAMARQSLPTYHSRNATHREICNCVLKQHLGNHFDLT